MTNVSNFLSPWECACIVGNITVMHEHRARFHQKNMIKGDDNPQQHAPIFNEWCPHPHHDFTQKSSCSPLWHLLIEHLWFIHHTKFIETTPFPSAYSFLLSVSTPHNPTPNISMCEDVVEFDRRSDLSLHCNLCGGVSVCCFAGVGVFMEEYWGFLVDPSGLLLPTLCRWEVDCSSCG